MISRFIWQPALLPLIITICGLATANLAQGAKPSGGGGGTSAIYRITDLGGFIGGSNVQSEPYRISDLSADGLVTIAGRSWINSSRFAAIWEVSAAGGVLNLQTVPLPAGATYSEALAVNDNGLVVGWWSSSGTRTAFADVPGIGPRVLSSADSVPVGVNNDGFVVSNDFGFGKLRHIDPEGNVTGPISLGSFYAQDINEQGVVAGVQDGVPAIVWLDADLLPQSQLLPVPTGCTGGRALAINNFNQVVGLCYEPETNSTSGDVFYRAFVWDPIGGVKSIGDFGGNRSVAYDINDEGAVVGTASKKGNGGSRAFLWKNGKLSDLNTLAGAGSTRTLGTAFGINNDGRIVGTMSTNGETHGFLLTPTP